jgi:hypothetical protein
VLDGLDGHPYVAIRRRGSTRANRLPTRSMSSSSSCRQTSKSTLRPAAIARFSVVHTFGSSDGKPHHVHGCYTGRLQSVTGGLRDQIRAVDSANMDADRQCAGRRPPPSILKRRRLMAQV